jgi:hypothetical protein
MTSAPGFWMYETSGRLESAIWALLEGDRLRDDEIALIRAYLRRWINAPGWGAVDDLRRRIDELTSTEAINRWLDDALQEGIDPL